MVFILHKLYFLTPYPNPTPKSTPHTKLSAFLHFQNTSFCMIYKLFPHGDQEMSPQVQNLLVLLSLWGHNVPIVYKYQYTHTKIAGIILQTLQVFM